MGGGPGPSLLSMTIYRGGGVPPVGALGMREPEVVVRCPSGCVENQVRVTKNPFLSCSRCGERMLYVGPRR